MDFRSRLLSTLRAAEPVLRVPGVLVAGSEVPNLLQPGVAASLVVSQDVDLAVPVQRHGTVKRRLAELKGLDRSSEEPSVWLPKGPGLLEINFIGMDPGPGGRDETYVVDDAELPLLVFRNLRLLSPGPHLYVGDLAIPMPRPAGLLLEKLLTDRSGEKGDRDLLVALGLLLVCSPADVEEVEQLYRTLPAEDRFAVRSGLSTLSLLQPLDGMPDPGPARPRVAHLLARFESLGTD